MQELAPARPAAPRRRLQVRAGEQPADACRRYPEAERGQSPPIREARRRRRSNRDHSLLALDETAAAIERFAAGKRGTIVISLAEESRALRPSLGEFGEIRGAARLRQPTSPPSLSLLLGSFGETIVWSADHAHRNQSSSPRSTCGGNCPGSLAQEDGIHAS